MSKIKSAFPWIILLPLLAFYLSSCDYVVDVPESPYPISEDIFQVDTLTEGFFIPYGIAVISDDEYLITDRIGKLFRYEAGKLTEIQGVPESTTFNDPGLPMIRHGGLMELSLHPRYDSIPWVYLAYFDLEGFARVSRLKIKNDTVQEIEEIFKTRSENIFGNGMRIVWQDDTHFFLNVGGSTFSTNTDPVMVCQDLNIDAGKIHRLMEDGGIPEDNPIFDGQSGPLTIWSYGHRDVQGLVYDQKDSSLVGIEHGPKGGDEFNVIEAGQNYGWPLFTYGIHYDGTPVSTMTEAEAAQSTILPEHYWTVPTDDGGQAIAPACLLKVENSNISDWNDHYLIGSLAYRRLMKFNRETKETYGLTIEGRVRTVAQLPSGDILVLVEHSDSRVQNGMILRISA